MNREEWWRVVRAAVDDVMRDESPNLVATTVIDAICPEGHTVEVFGPEWERTEEDGKIVWQKKKPYWWVSESYDDAFSVTSLNYTACTYALPNAKERAEKLAAELNRDYPNGLPK